MDTWQIVTHPFSLGLGLGMVFAALAVFRLWGAKRDLGRYKRLLSDKLEAEAEASVRNKQERDRLARENENLRAHVHGLEQLPDRAEARDLEVYARAEKQLILQAPGFAQAWETAKQNALADIDRQAAGSSLPRKVFRKIFGGTPPPESPRPAQSPMLESGQPQGGDGV